MMQTESVIRGHVKRLIKSMEEVLFSPIFIDKNHNIIDGQHRFSALKEIGGKIIFCVLKNVGLEQVTRYNINSKTWGDDDFMHMYVDLGYSEYKKYKEFKEKYKINHTSCKSLLGGFIRKTTKRQRWQAGR